MNLRYVQVADSYIAVNDQETVVGVLKLLPLQSYPLELKSLKTAKMTVTTPREIYLSDKVEKLQKEIEELKQNQPMTAVQHLSRLKTQAEMIRKVYYDACNITK